MLALDSTIGCIEASESDVLALYRSAPITTTGVAGSKPESLEAYLCAIRKNARRNARVHVYVALVADNKRIFVYTRLGEPDPEGEYHHTLQEALDFTRSMGFTLEQVNLDYGAAMREVVVRNTKILRPPGSKVNAFLRHGMANAPTPADPKKTPALKKQSSFVSPGVPTIASPIISPVTSSSATLTVLAVAPRIAPTAPTVAPSAPSALSAPTASSVVPAVASSATASVPPTPELVIAPPAMMAAAVGPLQSSSDEELAVLRETLSRMADENKAIHKKASEEMASLREKLARALSDSERKRERLSAVTAEFLKDQKIREKAYAKSLSDLKEELKALSASRDAQSMKTQELSALHATELATVREERSRLSSERDALALRLEAIEATSPDLAALQREIVTLSGLRLEANRRELDLAAESAAQAEAFTKAQQEIADLTLERDAAQKLTQQLAAEIGISVAEREALRAEVATLSAQREEAIAQREKALLRAGDFELESAARAAELEALRKEVATLSAQREEAFAQREEALLRGGKFELESATRAAELEAVLMKVATLSAEHEMLQKLDQELSFVGKTWKAETPATEPRFEDSGSRHTLEGSHSPSAGNQAEVAEQRFELPELIPELPPELPSQLRPRGETDCPDTARAKLQDLPHFIDPDDDFFSSETGNDSCHGRFVLHPGLTCIECASPDDVVELHQSINVTYLSPDGKGQESCQGYVCCLGKTGVLQVFAAIFGTKSGRTWVYLPEVQPADEPTYLSAVKGAMSFAEEVGFIMEPVDLGATVRQHGETVRRFPVLKCA